MAILLHTPSPEMISTSSDASQTKHLLSKRSIAMKLTAGALLIDQEKLSGTCGKYFTKNYALENNFLNRFFQFYGNINRAVKIILW